MATVVPSVPELPPAPQRQMSSSTYPVVADTWAAAINPWTLKVNLFGTWMGQQIDGIAISKQAAQQSAAAAADSASAANSSKNAAAAQVVLAADQVVLAQQQVTLANNAKSSAEAAAAAAGSAAGLPSLAGNAYKVLRATANGLAVEWGLGLPSVIGVAVGKTLVVGAGNTVSWVEKYNIGDTLMSAVNPGSLWLPADGSIRAQSSYPALFAALGIMGINVGQAWSTVSTGSSVGVAKTASDENGTVIILNNDFTISRSTDYGVTFTLQPTTRANATNIATDGNGTWLVITSAIAGTAYRSTDNGLTWNTVTLPSTSSNGWQKIVYAGNNVWLGITTSIANSNIARSTNGGATWAGVAHGLGSVTLNEIGADKNTGVCLISQGTTVRRSSDYGATWSTILTAANTIQAIGTDGAGAWLISGSNGVTNTYLSKNNAIGFVLIPMPTGAGDVRYIAYANLTFFLQIPSAFPYTYVDSIFSQIGTAPSGIQNCVHTGKGILVGPGASVGTAARSLPYSYDTATQFQLPRQVSPVGLQTYIKAVAA